MPTPQITLTATLQNIFGDAEGATGNPSRISVTLCGFGPILPRIAGTSMLARVGPTYLESVNGAFSTLIYGNDAITPAGTYYAVEILDENGNVVQSAAYELTGSGTQDLSGIPPIPNPGYSTPSGYIRIPNATGAVKIDSTGWPGPLTVDLTLIGNVTLTLVGLTKGQVITWIFRQDGTGGRTVTWPGVVNNPALVNSVASSVSTQSMIVDYLLNLYPQNGWS